jgi:glycosyltransferase involved in cell wall biosynthesis
MTRPDQTLCLSMIVKNEAHVIRRCLASVRPILDHWIVVDTGSTDGTQDVVREAMSGLPGALVERPWVDFAHNRNEALALARPHSDYSFIIDADDELALAPDFALPPLDADSYSIDIHYGATTYRRPQFVRNALAWRYRGVLHEFLECPEAKTSGHLPIVMKINHEGRRSADPRTYAGDAALLEAALATETDPFLISRYTFYLAQSRRDAGYAEAAIEAYLARTRQGFWIEEVYQSFYQAARLMERLGRDPDEVIATYRRASEACPFRAEAAHGASRLCRLLSRFEEGYRIAKSALGATAPPEGLFVEAWIYEYGLYDEFAVNAYWSGHYRDCLDACLRAMQGGAVPAAEAPRFLANMRFALDKLP